MATRLEKAILGKKIGMTQIFIENGQAVPVTVIQAGPCTIVKCSEKVNNPDLLGVQLGFEEVPENKRRRVINKPMAGYFKKAGISPHKHLKEFKYYKPEGMEVGASIKADIFAAGERVNIAGISKGKGFSGAMKRHGFHGGPATHGSMSHRRPASGGATDAVRTFKGAKKPGHMGALRVTTKGIMVVKVVPEKDLLLVKGAVPGPNGGLLEITTQAATSAS